MTGASSGMGARRPIEDRAARRICRLAADLAGVALEPGNIGFLENRLLPRLRALGLASFSEYCALLETPSERIERRRFLSAITTNTTGFFRETAHYDWLDSEGFRYLLQEGAGRDRPLSIWSAACSSGQELYSSLMLARNFMARGNLPFLVRGFGTDLSSEMIRRAVWAVYHPAEIDSLPLSFRRKYLLSSKSGDGRGRIVPELRAMAEWREANLLAPASLGSFRADLVFLRNVLIYFSAADQRRILETVLARLVPNGILMTGHSEGASVRDLGLVSLHPAIFRKEG